MTRIEITIQNGRVTWLEQKGEPLPDDVWGELNVAIKGAVEH